ncbi:hypothetical protein TNCV_3887851 [Trichonephila clavipes]|nr:hypothetical protein TNCV_3887851 [Trichonephila clavipes]
MPNSRRWPRVLPSVSMRARLWWRTLANLFVESFKTAPVLHVQDSSVPNAILVRLWVQTFIQKVQDMRRMQNGSKPSIPMVYEACMRAQRPERMPNSPVEPEIPTPPVERPERPVEIES